MDADDARSHLEAERERLAALKEGYEEDGLTSESEEASLGELSAADMDARPGKQAGAGRRHRRVELLEICSDPAESRSCEAAAGAVPGTCNIAPDYCVGIYEAFRRGDVAAAQALQLKLSPLRLGLAIGTAPGPIKAAMNVLGQNVGPSRQPIAPLPPEKQEKLRGILKQMGL